jgi:hypothetical protein
MSTALLKLFTVIGFMTIFLQVSWIALYSTLLIICLKFLHLYVYYLEFIEDP